MNITTPKHDQQLLESTVKHNEVFWRLPMLEIEHIQASDDLDQAQKSEKTNAINSAKHRVYELVMLAIQICAKNFIPIPNWASERYILAYDNIETMKDRSWDDALYKPHNQVTEKTYRFNKEKSLICVVEIKKWLEKKATKKENFVRKLAEKHNIGEKIIRKLIDLVETDPFINGELMNPINHRWK